MQTNTIQYIRCFDLGGSGLKTALVAYDSGQQTIKIQGSVSQLGKCSSDEKVSKWVRRKLKEMAGCDLDKEVGSGYLFGLSLAGLDKLKKGHLESNDIPKLFKLPKDRTGYGSDGNAHLQASLKSVPHLPEGRIWNIALGTGVGFGFTNSKKEPKPSGDLKIFFGREAYNAEEPTTGKGIWEAGSGPAFDKIVDKNGHKADGKAFKQFAVRWKAFIEKQILERCDKEGKDWGKPNAIVFTGGHIEHHGDKLIQQLRKLGLKIPVYAGPNQAGILGAAWNAVARLNS